jgi:outer membrane protein OmpA-like peptidoglycan-associated protein
MKKIFTIIFLLSGILALKAQNMLGFHTDNYSGIYSLDFNPAEIVDSRYKFHMNIFSVSSTVSNNYLGLKRKAFFVDTAFNDPNFDDNYIVEKLNGEEKSVYQNLEIGFLPSFMFTFGKDIQHAIAFNYRLRTYANANGIDERTARQSYNEQEIAELYNVGIQNKNLSIQAAIWNEYGFSYGREIMNKGVHYLKVAGTLKLTQGLGSAYFYSDNADIVFPSDSTLTIRNTDLKFGYSEVMSQIPGNAGDVFKNTKFGFGADLGVVYEFRPELNKYKYTMDGDSNYLNPTKNKYRLKAGFAVTDLGYLRFDRARGYDANFYANRENINLRATFSDAFEDFANTGLQGFNDTLVSIFSLSRDNQPFYLMPMPTRFNLYVDYNIWRGVYVNLTACIAPGYIKTPEKTRAISEFSITPRFENSWFGFYLPVSVNSHGNFHLGTALRLGPLMLGSYDLTPLLTKQTIYDFNFYMALSVPITRKLKDRDKDHVSNKMDECKREPGPLATKGCPDKDGDGVVDVADKCMDIPGLEELNGCPDKDGDKITDTDDKCPEIAGLVEFKGCPDTDGDKIADPDDKCPEQAGFAELGGCPDADGDRIADADDRCPQEAGSPEMKGCPDKDGDKFADIDDKCPDLPGVAELSGCPDRDSDMVIDPEDKCPEVPGRQEHEGCPDADNDGTPDHLDQCIDVAGPKDNKGCPYQDDDKDGVLDKDDECPHTAGPASNKGCPIIKEEIKHIVEEAFDHLEFETGKSVIKATSFQTLTDLANVLKKNNAYELKISGHTDNVGTEADNLVLSKARAEAVKNFLVQKGIDAKRFFVDGFGSSKPIADNKTEAGRKKNRRVELKIVFE